MIKDFRSLDHSIPNDIMIYMLTILEVNANYYKAWRTKKLAMNFLNGEAKELCLDPKHFTNLKEVNPCVLILIIYMSSIKP